MKTFYQADDRTGRNYFAEKPVFIALHEIFTGGRVYDLPAKGKYRLIKHFVAEVIGGESNGYPKTIKVSPRGASTAPRKTTRKATTSKEADLAALDHAPLPYRLLPVTWADSNTIGIESFDSGVARVVTSNGFVTKRVRDNARFIVRACNAHYDLLEACKLVLPTFKTAAILGDTAAREVADKVMAAMRKAKL